MRSHKKPSKLSILFGKAERKVVIIFLYYILVGTIVLVAFGLNSNDHHVYRQKLLTYFACESTTPGNCDNAKSGALRYLNPEINDIAYILLALFPLVNLVYAFNYEELKQICCARFHVKKTHKVSCHIRTGF